ncbi:zinc-binding dehydrogenase [Mycobacterium hodleri]|uniref:Zinc-binding dehydrogenase n=1 Tax=Mycolicibacterium hodleri TaxID=49897 RepID=A0A544W7N8_9MYCO|nr:alcohol dehydrogenase catalytic domain-containing protein [Mycolicibacterium hodleri]TQR88219.1 zinc-binding dehydrogenase [Mycolicibacterium hodleri]
MRASVYHGAHDVRVEDVPEPVRRPGEAILRVLRSGVCGTDATEWSSGPKTFPVNRVHPVTAHSGPMILGHEFVGEVVEAADGGRYGQGDVVASGAGVSCGECGRCREGRTNLCDVYYTLGLNTGGGMAEYVSVPERVLTLVPAEMSLDSAGLAQPMAVGLHAARRAGASDGDRVVLIGAGAIGSFVLAGLKSLADVDVTVVDFPGARLERAQRLGAARTVAAGTDAVSELRGVEVVIEASGAQGQLNNAIGMVRTGGTILQVGLPSRQQEVDVHTLVMREISIITTLAHVCGEDLGAALEILSATDLVSEVLESVHPLEDLPEQLELLATGKSEGKVLFDPRAKTTKEDR